MIRFVALAITGCAGLLVLLWGLFPPRPSLQSRLLDASSQRLDNLDRSASGLSLQGRFGVWLLSKLQRDSLPDLQTDMRVSGIDLETFAIDKIRAAVGGGLIVAILAFLRGWARGFGGLTICFLVGAAAGYFAPDVELKRKAAGRRDEFERALSSFVTLVAVSVTGGSGINNAMKDAAALGSGWCFRLLDQSLDESALRGESPWTGFEDLGRRIGSPPLLELAGALALAGNSGARIAETLTARADSARDKELAAAHVEAERQSERMNTPIGIMLFAWMIILGYPAMGALIGS